VHRQIGYVTQETHLFAGTLRENLQFVKPDATDESGSHAELLDAKGLYYAMWRQQIGERPSRHASSDWA